jgi:hypothetical protein
VRSHRWQRGQRTGEHSLDVLVDVLEAVIAREPRLRVEGDLFDVPKSERARVHDRRRAAPQLVRGRHVHAAQPEGLPAHRRLWSQQRRQPGERRHGFASAHRSVHARREHRPNLIDGGGYTFEGIPAGGEKTVVFKTPVCRDLGATDADQGQAVAVDLNLIVKAAHRGDYTSVN